MKKTLLMLGLMFTALTLTNCTKHEEQDVTPGKLAEKTFELFANPTRTTTDGISTSWAAADEINVFHAVAGTTNYVHNTATASFSIAEEDLATGRFLGSLAEELDPSTNYDWYVFYPYTKQITTPGQKNSGYVYVGQGTSATSAQVQNGNNSMAHISGIDYPLYGIATNIPGSQTPDIVMHHLTSVLEVVVTNNAEEEITVSSITFKTANTDIVGTYFIDFSSEPVTYQPSGTQYVSNQATLNVTNGAPIAVGESAKFYLAIKPFTTSNDTLTLTVTTDKGVCEKSIDLTSETSFVAGNIKPLNIGFTAPEQEPEQEYIWGLVTSLDEIVEGEYIMVVKTDSGAGYLQNSATSKDPAHPTIEIDEASNTVSSTITDDMKWTFSGTTSAMTIANANGEVLKATATSTTVAIGTDASFKGWKITAHPEGTSNAFALQSNSNNRYLGIYITNNVWRAYASTTQANFASEIYLYKKGELALPALAAPTGLSVSNDVITWNAVDNAVNYTVTVGSVSETVSETSYTYTGEAGIFDVSVVANPADAATYRPSAAATLTGVKFGNVSTVTDILVSSAFVATNTQYRDFSGVTFTSNAIYAGNNAKTSNGGIQLRKSSNTQDKSGIVTTASGGRAAKVVVTWESGTKSGRTLNIYGSNTPYTSAADLYDTSTQGTLIGTIVCGTSTELVITGDYPYIGLCSDDGAIYLTQIEITWEN